MKKMLENSRIAIEKKKKSIDWRQIFITDRFLKVDVPEKGDRGAIANSAIMHPHDASSSS